MGALAPGARPSLPAPDAILRIDCALPDARTGIERRAPSRGSVAGTLLAVSVG
jgi:hypothetical protein